MTEPLFYRLREAAAVLAISQSYVRTLVNDGRLRSTRLGNRIMIPVSEVQRFADELTKTALAGD